MDAFPIMDPVPVTDHPFWVYDKGRKRDDGEGIDRFYNSPQGDVRIVVYDAIQGDMPINVWESLPRIATTRGCWRSSPTRHASGEGWVSGVCPCLFESPKKRGCAWGVTEAIAEHVALDAAARAHLGVEKFDNPVKDALPIPPDW